VVVVVVVVVLALLGRGTISFELRRRLPEFRNWDALGRIFEDF
jgi:hypothetical protein